MFWQCVKLGGTVERTDSILFCHLAMRKKGGVTQIDVMWGLILLPMSTRLIILLANEISSFIKSWCLFCVLAHFWLCILLADVDHNLTRAGETTNTYFVEKDKFGSEVCRFNFNFYF